MSDDSDEELESDNIIFTGDVECDIETCVDSEDLSDYSYSEESITSSEFDVFDELTDSFELLNITQPVT